MRRVADSSREAAAARGRALQAELDNGRPPRSKRPPRPPPQELGCGPALGCLPFWLGIPLEVISELVFIGYQELRDWRRWRRQARRDRDRRTPSDS